MVKCKVLNNTFMNEQLLTLRSSPWLPPSPTGLWVSFPTYHTAGSVKSHQEQLELCKSQLIFPSGFPSTITSNLHPCSQETQGRFHTVQILQPAHSWTPRQRSRWSQRSVCWEVEPLRSRRGSAWEWRRRPDPEPQYRWACDACWSSPPVDWERWSNSEAITVLQDG